MTNEVFDYTINLQLPAATGGIAKGTIVAIDPATSTVVYAASDTPTALPVGVSADDYDAGDYVSIHKPGAKAYVKTKAIVSTNGNLGWGVAADSGEAVECSGAGEHRVVARLLEDSAAGELALARIVEDTITLT